MLKVKNKIVGKLSTKNKLNGKINNKIIYVDPITQEKEVTPTKEIQEITPDENYTGLSKVKINSIPDEYIIPDGELDVNANGDVDVTNYKWARVGVYTPPTLQDKSITITENRTQNITFDNGYDGLNSVQITTNVEATQKEVASLEDIRTTIDNDTFSIISYLMDYSNTYETYTNEPVTLYTPSADCKYYTIRCRGINTYSILWLPPIFLKYYSVALFHTVCLIVSQRTYHADGTMDSISGTGVSLGGMSIIGYYSSNYSSIEECIEAMKSPNTTYTQGTSAYKWSFDDPRQYGWSEYAFPCTNLPCFENDILLQSKKVSSDETIEIIPTA